MISLPLTVLPCSPLKQIEAAAAAGYDAIGLRLAPSCRPISTCLPSRRSASPSKTASRRLASASSTSRSPASCRRVTLGHRATAGLRRQARCALHPGDRRLAGGLGQGDDEALLPTMEDLADRAAAHGLELALEFVVFRSLRSLSQALTCGTVLGATTSK